MSFYYLWIEEFNNQVTNELSIFNKFRLIYWLKLTKQKFALKIQK